MDAGDGVRRELLKDAVTPVLARIRADAARAGAARAGAVLQPVFDVLLARFLDHDLNVSVLFSAAGVRGGEVKMRFHWLAGASPRAYLEARRFEVAVHLFVLAPRLPLEHVARAAGFAQLKSFKTAFTRFFNLSPGRVRRLLVSGEIPNTDLEATSLRRAIVELQRAAEPVVVEPSGGDPPRIDDGTRDPEEIHWRIFRECVLPCLKEATPRERREIALLGLRFETAEPFRFLLQKSREECGGDLARGVVLAQTALDTLEWVRDRLPAEEYRSFKVEGLMALADARRLAADCQGAERAFKQAELELASMSLATAIDASAQP